MARKSTTNKQGPSDSSPSTEAADNRSAGQTTKAHQELSTITATSLDVAAAEETPKLDCLIVGIGASAGGLDAFKKFFSSMPADSGMAFVLIPHLDPTHESLMVELLSRQTAMPVIEPKDGTSVEANRVYIIPPNNYLAISQGVLRLSAPPKPRGLQTAIDFFLRSLAADQRERAVGIVLSGTGSHGTPGIREIKMAGGLVMAQEPESAEYDQMPRSAIASGAVDYVLPPQEMPKALLKYAEQPYLNRVKDPVPSGEASDQLNRISPYCERGPSMTSAATARTW